VRSTHPWRVDQAPANVSGGRPCEIPDRNASGRRRRADIGDVQARKLLPGRMRGGPDEWRRGHRKHVERFWAFVYADNELDVAIWLTHIDILTQL